MIEIGDTFKWRDMELPYLVHDYNNTGLNERAVEVPAAASWLLEQAGDGLELGNVLSHYMPITHRVVDLFEEAEHVQNLNVFDIGGRYDWIAAISTLEHIYSYSSPHPYAPMDAIDHLLGLLRPSGELFVTIPFGQQPYLDVAILDGILKPFSQGTFLREEDETWQWYNNQRIWRSAREHGCARAVWDATWRKHTRET
jgi:hypothetical protein